jgi:hypothetical protein
VRDALEARQLAPQELAAPERAVGAIAGPVEDQRQRGSGLAVLGKTRRGMCVMVLDADELGVLLECPLRREVLGVEVVCDDFRLDTEHSEVELEIGAEGAVCGLGVEIAKVGREERLLAARDAERALQLGAGRDQRAFHRKRKPKRLRGVAPRAAEGKPGARDRILTAPVDRPVVSEEGVGDPGKPRVRLLVFERDRLVGAVPAREHERTAEVVAQDVVERGVGEHQAKPGGSRRDRRGDRRVRAPPNQDDGVCGRAQQSELFVGEVGDLAGGRRHEREGLLLPALAAAQTCDGVLTARVAGEVIAADPLDRDDRSLAEEPNGLLERNRELWPAHGAAGRLGVEAAVAGILVLAAALVAHREADHRRIRAVVWKGAHDREAWAALRAVEERVAVAAVRRIEELAQAVVAGGDVRWHQGACTRRPARQDPEASFAARGHRLDRHGGDVGERRGFCAERAHERLELPRLAFHLDHDALTVVQDEAG